MVLIDRTPPAERHLGANERWDDVEFRLRMAQERYEKRFRSSSQLSIEIRNLIRRDLAAVHSEWANLFLQQREYGKAREAIAQAARISVTPNLAIKWRSRERHQDLPERWFSSERSTTAGKQWESDKATS